VKKIKLLLFTVSILLLSASIANAEVFLFKWGSPGAGEGQFNGPHGIAIDSSDDVYVVDSGNNRVQKFTRDGTFIREWGSLGTGEGQFNNPIGIEADSSDDIWVADHNNHRIQKFDRNGNFLEMWGWGVQDGSSTFQTCTSGCQQGKVGTGNGQFNGPNGIAIDSSDDVYVVENDNNRVQKFESDGEFITMWGGLGSGDGEFTWPLEIEADSSDNIYIADHSNNRIQKFTSAGAFILKWGLPGNSAGQFNGTGDIAVNSLNYVYVVDEGNDRVQKFTSDGEFITMWGGYGSGDGQFIMPRRIEVNSLDNVYVSEINVNDRIQVFSDFSPGIQNPDNGHWYQRFDSPTMTWHEARNFCESLGGHLATITSEAEDNFVYENLGEDSPSYHPWLGATDEIIEDTWVWVTGEPWDYSNWAPQTGEPNNCEGIEHYLVYFTPWDGDINRWSLWNDLGTGEGGGCGCGGCISEWYNSSTICEWELEKIDICHKPGKPRKKTLSIAPVSVRDHLNHGDYLGPCVP